MGILAIAWVGAAIGMCVGIVWTIEYKVGPISRFMLDRVMGLVVGIMLSVSTNSGEYAMVVIFSGGNIYGIVCALATVGAFRDK